MGARRAATSYSSGRDGHLKTASITLWRIVRGLVSPITVAGAAANSTVSALGTFTFVDGPVHSGQRHGLSAM